MSVQRGLLLRGTLQDIVLILGVHHGLSLNMLSFSLQCSPPGREYRLGGEWGFNVMGQGFGLQPLLLRP